MYDIITISQKKKVCNSCFYTLKEVHWDEGYLMELFIRLYKRIRTPNLIIMFIETLRVQVRAESSKVSVVAYCAQGIRHPLYTP